MVAVDPVDNISVHTALRHGVNYMINSIYNIYKLCLKLGHFILGQSLVVGIFYPLPIKQCTK